MRVGIALLGSVLVETGSYAWPLPVVAVVALVVGVGVLVVVGQAPSIEVAASQSSIEPSADALSASGAPDPTIDAAGHRRQRVVVETHLGAGQLVLVRAAPVRTTADRRR